MPFLLILILELVTFSCVYSFLLNVALPTVHAALTVASDVILQADTGHSVGMVFIDIKNAFPSANHEILLNKLHHYGIKGSLHKWYASYLLNRIMFVELNGIQSRSRFVTKGVLQGSALGRFLFLIYINDIINALDSRITLFADDMELHV